MKNMKQKLMDEMKQGAANIVGDIAMKVGVSATDRLCIGWVYETEIPHELLNDQASTE